MFNRYVCHRRAKFDGIGGKVNIPYGTVLTNQGGILMHKGTAVCMDTSQHAYDFFHAMMMDAGWREDAGPQTLLRSSGNRMKTTKNVGIGSGLMHLCKNIDDRSIWTTGYGIMIFSVHRLRTWSILESL